MATRWPIVLASVALMYATACTGESTDPDVTVMDAFTIPGERTVAVYVKIDNAGGADRIVGAELSGVDGAIGESVSLHRSVEQDGLSIMEPVSSLEIPADSSTALVPGQGHLMIEELARPIVDGDRLQLTVRFDLSPPETVTVRTVSVEDALAALETQP